MDGILMDGRTGKLWMCKKKGGHALGLQIRVREDGRNLDLLLEFRHALEIGEVSNGRKVCLTDVSISGELEGTKRGIECTICHEKRTWYWGEAGIERFLESRKRRIAAEA